MLLRELNEARCGQPFEKLGWVYDNEQSLWRLRVWQPHATEVAVRRIEKKKVECKLKCLHADGLFEAEFTGLTATFPYVLKVTYGDVNTEVTDPYQFHDEAFRGLAELKHSADNVYRT